MKITLIFFLFIFKSNLILVSLNVNVNNLVEFVLGTSQEIHKSNFIIICQECCDEKSNRGVSYLKAFSHKSNYSMVIRPDVLRRTVDYYDSRRIKPSYVILIETSRDFENFVKFTKTRIPEKPMSSYKWLVVFISTNQTLIEICEQPLENYFNLVFDAKMMVVCNKPRVDILIREWYSLHLNETSVYDYAIWKNSNLTRFDNLRFLQRRHLDGITIRTTRIKNDASDYAESFMEFLEKINNFQRIHQERDYTYGVYNTVSAHWNGVIGKLAKHETNVGVADFAMTTARLNIADFSVPIVTVPGKYYIKKPKDNVLQWSMYLKAVGKDGVIGLMTIFIGVPPLIGFIMVRKQVIRGSTGKILNAYLKILRNSFFDVFGILCKMPVRNFSDISSLRIIYLTLIIVSFIISTIYSGFLMSYYTVFKPSIPFQSIQEFIRDGTYKIVVPKDSYYHQYVKNQETEKFIIKEEYLPLSNQQAVDMACNVKKVVVYMDDFNVNTKNLNLSCELIAFDKGSLLSLAIAFEKHSPFTQFFNIIIEQMRTGGLMDILKQRNQRRHFEDKNLHYEPVSSYSVLPIFAILMLGMLLAVIILFWEILYYYINSPNPDFIRTKTNYWAPIIRPPKM